MQSLVLIPADHRVADSQDSQRFQVEPKPCGRVLAYPGQVRYPEESEELQEVA